MLSIFPVYNVHYVVILQLLTSTSILVPFKFSLQVESFIKDAISKVCLLSYSVELVIADLEVVTSYRPYVI